jgi:hypothetical protein
VPVTLGIVGGIGGFTLGAFAGVACCDEEAGMIALPMLGSVGGAVGGSLLGREAVRKTVTIYVTQPDSSYAGALSHATNPDLTPASPSPGKVESEAEDQRGDGSTIAQPRRSCFDAVPPPVPSLH